MSTSFIAAEENQHEKHEANAIRPNSPLSKNLQIWNTFGNKAF